MRARNSEKKKRKVAEASKREGQKNDSREAKPFERKVSVLLLLLLLLLR